MDKLGLEKRFLQLLILCCIALTAQTAWAQGELPRVADGLHTDDLQILRDGFFEACKSFFTENDAPTLATQDFYVKEKFALAWFQEPEKATRRWAHAITAQGQVTFDGDGRLLHSGVAITVDNAKARWLTAWAFICGLQRSTWGQ